MHHRGAVIMVLSALIFALMSAQVRALVGVDSYVTMMVRFAFGVVVVAGLHVTGIARTRWTNWPWIVVRGVTGGIAVSAFFWSIQHVGLARATVLCYTSAVFAAIFAGPLLRETMNARQWASVGLATVGMALVVGVEDLSVSAGDLIALSSGVLSGIAVVSVAKCRETESSISVFGSQALFGMLIVAWPTCQHWAMPTALQWWALLAIGLMATVGQLAMTYAYKYTGASYGSLLSLLAPVMASAIGVVHFGERLGPGFYVGAALVLLACGYLSVHPVRRASAVSQA